MYLLCISNLSGMHLPHIPMRCQCIRDVLLMYCGCKLPVINLYLSCITDVLEVVPYTPVFLHTLAITFLGPSPSGHPVFGISRPWVWLLGGGGSHAAPDMLFCRQGMHIPACEVNSCSPILNSSDSFPTGGVPKGTPNLTKMTGKILNNSYIRFFQRTTQFGI